MKRQSFWWKRFKKKNINGNLWHPAESSNIFLGGLTLFKLQFFRHPKTSLLLKKALKRKVVV